MGALAEAGYQSTVLEAGELAKELRVALGVQGASSGPPDRWKSWVWGNGSQVCFRPRSSRVVDFSVPGATFTATSYTLTRTPGGREKAEVTVRVGARPGAAAPVLAAAIPLHGRHGAAVRQTLPLALDS